MAGLLDQIIGAESGGDPNAKNPRSSAGGLGQIIDSTWLDLLNRHRPDIKGSREELLKLKFDPALNKEMTDAYSSDNSAVLAKAGLPVNPTTTYLAHFAGPGGAQGILQADPSTPVAQILDARAMASNPFLKGMTAGDLTAWAGRKMGQTAAPAVQQPAAQPAQASPVSPFKAIPQGLAPMLPQAPLQPPSASSAPSAPLDLAQFRPEQMAAPPIFSPPKRPIDLRALRASLTRPTGGFFNARG